MRESANEDCVGPSVAWSSMSLKWLQPFFDPLVLPDSLRSIGQGFPDRKIRIGQTPRCNKRHTPWNIPDACPLPNVPPSIEKKVTITPLEDNRQFLC
jgi:hypothetical protein